MALLVDKLRPRSLDALTYHPELSDRLRALAQSGDFPHLLVYGPSGAGKKTRIIATLKELYGSGVEKIKIDARVFQTTSNRKLEFNIVSSVYHLEITPADVGTYDRVVVQELLKEVAQTQQVDLSAKQRFKVVVINEADHLTRDAQAALRRTMEKYSPNLRLILLANSTSNIIAPIRSRTLLVRVAAPTENDICAALRIAAKREGWTEADGLNKRIAKESGRNLRRALLMFESIYAQNEKVTDSTPIPPPDWEALISITAAEIIKDRSPAQLLQVRARLYDLLTHCIPPTTILKTLTFMLVSQVDDVLKPDVIKWSAFYEHRIKLGSKVIFHLEAFVAKFMRIYERYESIREFTQPPEKQTGQLGGGQPHTKSEMKTTFDKNGNGNGNGANGEEYAQAQKLGMGQGAQGKNKENRNSDNPVDAGAARTRREQGYGPGSGVGA
ncbi:Replication factor C subunit 5 [Penicillium subrubescens]|uniref:Replication factor C subunit 5 n=1 Tax=Penicillium subrubescens TaxID=1316194 RepID=A0A1Q5T8P7_9EURO|nr:Replication factor C subunit 5 [Penicillium subrubescens]